MDAGARLELAATGNESVMLPLHHPAGSEEIFYRLKEEATEGISETGNNKIFEFVKEIERHDRPLFESVDSKGLFDLTALLWGGRLNRRKLITRDHGGAESAAIINVKNADNPVKEIIGKMFIYELIKNCQRESPYVTKRDRDKIHKKYLTKSFVPADGRPDLPSHAYGYRQIRQDSQ